MLIEKPNKPRATAETWDILGHRETQNQHDEDNLNRRREKLKCLMKEEVSKHNPSDAETVPSRCTKFDEIKKLTLSMRSQREMRRQEYVQNQLYENWRRSVDDVRIADTKLFEAQVVLALDHQVREKKNRASREERQDQLFHSMWQENYREQLEQEILELEHRRSKWNSYQEDLNEQMEVKREKMKESKQEEERCLAELFAAQNEKDEALLQSLELKKSQEFALKESNAKFLLQQHKARRERSECDKLSDQTYTARIMQIEKEQECGELDARQKHRQELESYRRELEVAHKIRADKNKRLEQDFQDETNEMWTKRFEAWQKEEERCRKLLYQVYDERAQQVRLKQDEVNTLRERIQQERCEMIDKITQSEMQHALRSEQKREKCLRNSIELKKQMEEKTLRLAKNVEADKQEQIEIRNAAHDQEQKISLERLKTEMNLKQCLLQRMEL